MIYLYDNAIVEDLRQSFTPQDETTPIVTIADPESAIGIVAQLQEDNIKYPIVVLQRDPNYQIDTDRWNFTRAHKGVPVVIDNKANMVYNERILPITLSYTITLLTTNQADMDELERELLFKYTSMYFLSIELPYECKRIVRFGISITNSNEIERRSGSVEYNTSGQLYQTAIPIKCEGCVLIHNTPHKLPRYGQEPEMNLT